MSTVIGKIGPCKRINVFLHYITREDIERKGGIKIVMGIRNCSGVKDTYSIQEYCSPYIDDNKIIRKYLKKIYHITSKHVVNVVRKWYSGTEFPMSYYSLIVYDSSKYTHKDIAKLTSEGKISLI